MQILRSFFPLKLCVLYNVSLPNSLRLLQIRYAMAAAMWRRTVLLKRTDGALSPHLFTCTEPGNSPICTLLASLSYL